MTITYDYKNKNLSIMQSGISTMALELPTNFALFAYYSFHVFLRDRNILNLCFSQPLALSISPSHKTENKTFYFTRKPVAVRISPCRLSARIHNLLGFYLNKKNEHLLYFEI
jgi:hypothetical protein